MPPKQANPVTAKRSTRSSQENSQGDTDKKESTTSRFFDSAPEQDLQPDARIFPGTAHSTEEKNTSMQVDDFNELAEPELPASDRSESSSLAHMDVDFREYGAGEPRGSVNNVISLETSEPNSTGTKTTAPRTDDVAASNVLRDKVHGLSIGDIKESADQRPENERFVDFQPADYSMEAYACLLGAILLPWIRFIVGTPLSSTTLRSTLSRKLRTKASCRKMPWSQSTTAMVSSGALRRRYRSSPT